LYFPGEGSRAGAPLELPVIHFTVLNRTTSYFLKKESLEITPTVPLMNGQNN